MTNTTSTATGIRPSSSSSPSSAALLRSTFDLYEALECLLLNEEEDSSEKLVQQQHHQQQPRPAGVSQSHPSHDNITSTYGDDEEDNISSLTDCWGRDDYDQHRKNHNHKFKSLMFSPTGGQDDDEMMITTPRCKTTTKTLPPHLILTGSTVHADPPTENTTPLSWLKSDGYDARPPGVTSIPAPEPAAPVAESSLSLTTFFFTASTTTTNGGDEEETSDDDGYPLVVPSPPVSPRPGAPPLFLPVSMAAASRTAPLPPRTSAPVFLKPKITATTNNNNKNKKIDNGTNNNDPHVGGGGSYYGAGSTSSTTDSDGEGRMQQDGDDHDDYQQKKNKRQKK